MKLNRRVRYARGTNGALVLISAYCGGCRVQTIPNGNGACSWCDRQLLTPAVAREDELADEREVIT